MLEADEALVVLEALEAYLPRILGRRETKRKKERLES